MHINIFYSWQSDLPNKFNRSFIYECLDIAVKSLSNAEVFNIELRVDKDTQDIEGSPDIVHTIFDKIKKCQIFVADISIINLFEDNSGRKTPNPNVLLELGYAAACIGWDKILLIYNRDFGRVDDLPFDLKTRRPIFYDLSEDSIDKKLSQKKYLSNVLSGAIYEMSKNISLVETHMVTKMYYFYHRVISDIYIKCDDLINEICDYFQLEYPDSGIYPPDKDQIFELINSLNYKLSNEAWDNDKTESYIPESSEYITDTFENFLSDISVNVNLLINFKEGLDISLLSPLGKLLIYINLEKMYIYDKKIYRRLDPDSQKETFSFTKWIDVYILYCIVDANKLNDLILKVYELKNTFSANYNLHKEEFFAQENKKYPKQ